MGDCDSQSTPPDETVVSDGLLSDEGQLVRQAGRSPGLMGTVQCRDPDAGTPTSPGVAMACNFFVIVSDYQFWETDSYNYLHISTRSCIFEFGGRPRTGEHMKDIQKRELVRSIELIKALGCTFKVITPDGEAFGDLEVVEPRTRKVRRALKHPYGTITAHIKKYIDMDPPIGTVQEIPCAEFEPESMRATICPTLTRAWGAKTYTTATHPDRIEVMRISREVP